MKVIKKDGTLMDYNIDKVVKAISKSADRVLVKFTKQDLDNICTRVNTNVQAVGLENVPIKSMHSIVEEALEYYFPKVAKSYRDYRNYKTDFVSMLD